MFPFDLLLNIFHSCGIPDSDMEIPTNDNHTSNIYPPKVLHPTISNQLGANLYLDLILI